LERARLKSLKSTIFETPRLILRAPKLGDEKPLNEASRRVAEKCGFILEKTLKNYCVDCVSGKTSYDWMFVCFPTGISKRSNTNWKAILS